MKPRTIVPFAATGALALLALMLWLNLEEADVYLYALEGPPAGPVNADRPPWIPAEAEIARNLIACRVDDADGWYRLFWAADDAYWFDDASYFAGALGNSSAAGFEGRWTIAGTHAGRPFELRYALEEGEPRSGEAAVGPITAPAGILWFVRHYRNGPRTFSWRLERP